MSPYRFTVGLGFFPGFTDTAENLVEVALKFGFLFLWSTGCCRRERESTCHKTSNQQNTEQLFKPFHITTQFLLILLNNSKLSTIAFSSSHCPPSILPLFTDRIYDVSATPPIYFTSTSQNFRFHYTQYFGNIQDLQREI